MNFAALFYVFISTILICVSSTDIKSSLENGDPKTNEVDGKVSIESDEPSWWKNFKSTITGWLVKNRDWTTEEPWQTDLTTEEILTTNSDSWGLSTTPPETWIPSESTPLLDSSPPPETWPTTEILSTDEPTYEPSTWWPTWTATAEPSTWIPTESTPPPETWPPTEMLSTDEPTYEPSTWWPTWTPEPSTWWPTWTPEPSTWWPTWTPEPSTWWPTETGTGGPVWNTTSPVPDWPTTQRPPAHTDTIICKNSPKVDKNLDVDNYGDIICVSNDYISRLETLLIRDTVINYEDESSLTYRKNLDNLVVSKVNVLNFGRHHGLASSVSITNKFNGTNYRSSVDVKIQIPALEEVRLFVEIYGTMKYW